MITFFAFRFRKDRPWLAVGWGWYLISLVPVIGIIQVGMQAMADRYTYLPLIGIFMIISWGAGDLAAKLNLSKKVTAAAAFMVIAVLTALSFAQIGYWKNSITLFEHAIAVTQNNYIAHYNLGNAIAGKQQYEKALAHYLAAVEIRPAFADAHNNAGNVYLLQKNLDSAIERYEKTVKLDPGRTGAHYNLGIAYEKKGWTAEAAMHYKQALALNPEWESAWYKLGIALYHQGDIEGAVEAFQEGLKINPENSDARQNLEKLQKLG